MEYSRPIFLLSWTIIFFTLFSSIECTILDDLRLSAAKNKIARSRSSIDLSSYQVPLSNGTASLPPPSAALKAITLGRGTQNYTCNSTTSKPVLIGARASLLDLSPLLSYLPLTTGSDALNIVSMIPAYVLGFKTPTLVKQSGLDPIGHHNFNKAGVPCFFLGKAGMGVLKGKKAGDIVAPGGKGVDWLMLTKKPAEAAKRDFTSEPGHPHYDLNRRAQGHGQGHGNQQEQEDTVLQQVYRVDTAGGKPPPEGCGGKPHIEVEYAALYWFYGS